MEWVEDFPVWRGMFQLLLGLEPPANAVARLRNAGEERVEGASVRREFLKSLDNSLRGAALTRGKTLSSLPPALHEVRMDGLRWLPRATSTSALIFVYATPEGPRMPRDIERALSQNTSLFQGIQVTERILWNALEVTIEFAEISRPPRKSAKLPGHVLADGWATFTLATPECLLVGSRRVLRRTETEQLTWAEVLADPERPSHREILRRAARLSTQQYVDIGLCILEEWHHQRDNWLVKRMVDTKNRQFNVEHRVVLLTPSKLAGRLAPGSNDANWRQRLFLALQAMSLIGKVPNRQRPVRFIEAVVDLRDLALDPEPRSRLPDAMLARELLKAGVPSQDGFVVTLTPDLTQFMPPHKVDDTTGEPRWESAAVSTIERQDTSTEAYDERQRLNKMARFQLQPYAIAWANHLKLRPHTRRALYGILSEQRKTQKYADKTLAKTHYACFGQGQGYRVGTWTDRLVSRTVPTQLRRGALMKSLRELHEEVGLELKLPRQSSFSTEDVLVILRKSAKSSPHRAISALGGDTRLLAIYLPKNLLESANAAVGSLKHGVGLGDPVVKSLTASWNRDEVLARRTARGWTQSDLAERLGVSRALVAHWESGTRKPSENAKRTLAEVFGVEVTS